MNKHNKFSHKLSKSIFSVCVAVMLIATPATAYAGVPKNEENKIIHSTVWEKYFKKKENNAKIVKTVTIATKEDWLKLAEECIYDKASEGMYVDLVSDLKFNEGEFKPIPSFSGIFDGNNNTITFSYDDAGSAQGLFRYVEKTGVIKNLISNGSFSPCSKDEYIGGIAGVNSGLIDNCKFIGEINAHNYVGGITALNKKDGQIAECSNSGTVQGIHYTGGIVGANEGDIASCENAGGVNNFVHELRPELNIENFEEKLNKPENVAVHTDTGGIAGYSSGRVFTSLNNNTVGYKHVGYNVGGIIGRQSGFVYQCENNGNIIGRKDVGGIVGQAEPYLSIQYYEDIFQKIDRELGILQDRVSELVTDINKTTKNVNSNLGEIQHYLTKAQNELSRISEHFSEVEKLKDIDLNFIVSRLQDCTDYLDKANTAFFRLQYEFDDGRADIVSDIRDIEDQITNVRSVISKSKSDIMNDEKEILIDISDKKNNNAEPGKIAECKNFGPIDADTNVGGVVGSMSIEYDIDPETDFNEVNEKTFNSETYYRNVLQDVTNVGDVTGKKDNIGGLVGMIYMGAVMDSEAECRVESTEGSFVGGLVGYADGTIKNCSSLTDVYGKYNVGGVAGRGKNIINNVSMTRVYCDKAFYGTIAGSLFDDEAEKQKNKVNGNIYCDEGIGAIDNITYAKEATPYIYESFVEQKQVSDMFKSFKLRFLIDGNNVAEYEFNYGDTVDELPNIPEKEGYYSRWEKEELKNLVRSENINAEYIKWITSIDSVQKTDEGIPLVLAEDNFYEGTQVDLLPAEAPAIEEKETLLFNSRLGIKSDYIKTYSDAKFRVHLDDKYAKIRVLVDGGVGYVEVPHEVEGSYAVFNARFGDSVAIVAKPSYKWVVTLIEMTAVVIILLLLFIKLIRKLVRRLKKKRQEKRESNNKKIDKHKK